MSTKLKNGKRVTMLSKELKAIEMSVDGAKKEKHYSLDALAEIKRAAGIAVPGGRISTTDGAIARMLGAKEKDIQGRSVKVGMGKFVTLNPAEMAAVRVQVHDYIQACYDREEELAGEIEAALTVEALDSIDLDTGWPE